MDPSNLTVRHTPLKDNRLPEGAATLDKIVTAGSNCPAVQNDPLAKQAWTNLQGKVTTLHGSLGNKEQIAQTLLAAAKSARIDFDGSKEALVNYEKAVGTVANGNGAVINQAGLLSREVTTPRPALANVEKVTGKRGKQPAQAIVKWPEAAGATSYAVEVNFTPATPTGPFTSLGTATNRTRVVTAPTPGAQFLVRIAPVASNGTQGPWSDAVLVTAL